MEIKYLVLKMQNQFDIIDLIKKLMNEVHPGEPWWNINQLKTLALPMKWLNIAEILVGTELKD